MNKTTQTLSVEIEVATQLVVDAARRFVIAAVEEAFGGSTKSPAASLRSSAGGQRKTGGTSATRRTAAQLSELADRLCEAVRGNPGQKMVMLAALVGASPGELQAPMAQLKAAGRVTVVGQRQHTRYYPQPGGAVDGAPAQAAA